MNNNPGYIAKQKNNTVKITHTTKDLNIPTSIAPWLSVHNGAKAISFYKDAFGAVEVYHLENPGGIVARLSVDGAEFWVSGGSPEEADVGPIPADGGSVRMILTTANPDTLFSKALAAGASEVFPVGEEHGWRLGRLADPFGNHWEIGHPVVTPGE